MLKNLCERPSQIKAIWFLPIIAGYWLNDNFTSKFPLRKDHYFMSPYMKYVLWYTYMYFSVEIYDYFLLQEGITKFFRKHLQRALSFSKTVCINLTKRCQIRSRKGRKIILILNEGFCILLWKLTVVFEWSVTNFRVNILASPHPQ